jgi:hypothetical protein
VSEMKPRQWFQARLRWAVLEEGHGLCQWGEAEHIFLSEDREAAFQEALRLGYAESIRLLQHPIRRMPQRLIADSPKWSIWKNWGRGEPPLKCI